MTASRRRRNPIPWLVLALLIMGAPVAAGPITVPAPRAGETWCAGSTHVVSWTLDPATAATATVRLAYSRDDGRTWRDLADNARGSGMFRGPSPIRSPAPAA